VKTPKAKVFAFALCAMIFVVCDLASAQQPGKVFRIGFLRFGDESSSRRQYEAIRQGLHDLGYVEGKNVVIEYRQTVDRLKEFAAELVRLKVDLIVANDTQAVLAARNASRTIPIVMTTVGDPVASGLVDSLARPGGNITGLSSLSPDVSGKRIELLKETVRTLSRVAVLWNPKGSGSPLSWKESQLTARGLGIQVHSMEARGPDDLEIAFEEAIKSRIGALAVTSNPVFSANRKTIVKLAMKSRLPAIFPNDAWIEVGGLMSYGSDEVYRHQRAAIFVDKVLKGAKPAELPVEQPMKFEFVINLKTAKQIGLTIPPNVLARADRVIR
jgi:ABC-type uncharacterized transport system substrate-binding protein